MVGVERPQITLCFIQSGLCKLQPVFVIVDYRVSFRRFKVRIALVQYVDGVFQRLLGHGGVVGFVFHQQHVVGILPGGAFDFFAQHTKRINRIFLQHQRFDGVGRWRTNEAIECPAQYHRIAVEGQLDSETGRHCLLQVVEAIPSQHHTVGLRQPEVIGQQIYTHLK